MSNPTLSEVEAAFIKEAYRVREVMNQHNVSYFGLKFKMNGRCASGDLKFEIGITGSEYGSNEVTGSSTEVVLEEWLRRNGYEKKHQALCLPSIRPTTTEFGDRVVLNLEDDKKAETPVDEQEVPF